MANESVIMLDVILQNVQQMEDHITAMKKKIYEVNEGVKRDEEERKKLLDEKKQVEEAISSTRLSAATAQAHLESSVFQKAKLGERVAEVEAQRTACLQDMDVRRGREMKATGDWIKGLSKEYSRFRLDNPAIPARREAISQEIQQLNLEETRQKCEIKVLEDVDKEREKLELEVAQADHIEQELRQTIFTLSEKTDKVEGETELLLRRRDILHQSPSEKEQLVVNLREKLNELNQESEYLQAALDAMKKEWKSIDGIFSLEESGQPKEPQAEGYTKYRSKMSCSSDVNTQNQASLSEADADMNLNDFIDEIMRDINWTSDVDMPNIPAQSEKLAAERRDSSSKDRTSNSGPSPSTPRTFTRNPAPPTPHSQGSNRPLLQDILSQALSTNQRPQKTNPGLPPQHQPVATASTAPSPQLAASSTATTHQVPLRPPHPRAGCPNNPAAYLQTSNGAIPVGLGVALPASTSVQRHSRPLAPLRPTPSHRGNTQGSTYPFQEHFGSLGTTQIRTVRPSNHRGLINAKGNQAGAGGSFSNPPDAERLTTQLQAPYSAPVRCVAGKGEQPQKRGYPYGPWQARSDQHSPWKRRIRFNELAEVLGTPQSDNER